MGLHEVFSEFYEVDDNNRDGKFEQLIKCIDYLLGSELIMSAVEVI